MWKINKKGDRYAVSAVIGLNLFFFHSLLLGDRIPLQMDNSLQNIPFHYYAFQEISKGHIPLWCSNAALGFPFFAEGQSGAGYPLNWLFYLLFPFVSAYNYTLVFHCILSGLGFYFFLRSIRTSEIGSFTGSIVWNFNGYFLRKLMFVNFIRAFSWLPWILFVGVQAKKHRSKNKLIILSFLVYFIITAGHPQAVILIFSIGICFAVLTIDRKHLKGDLKGILVVFALGLVLSAYQWLPTLYMLTRSARSVLSNQIDIATQMSFPPGFCLSLIFPDLFGNAADGTFHGGWEAYEWELSSYIGIIAIMLAIAAKRSDPWNAFLRGLTIWGILLALGSYTPFYSLIKQVPFISSLRIPARWMVIFILGISALAGRGCMAIWDMEWVNFRKFIRNKWIVALVAWSCLVLFLVIKSYSGLELLKTNWVLWGAVSIAPFSILLFIKNQLLRKIIMCVLLIVMLWDYYRFGITYQGIGNPSFVLAVPDVIKKGIMQKDSHHRILSLAHESVSPWTWHSGWGDINHTEYTEFNNRFQMYSGLIHGYDLMTFDELSPLHDADYMTFLSRFKRSIPKEWLNKLSVRYVVVSGKTLHFALPIIYKDDVISIYENTKTNPKWRIEKIIYHDEIYEKDTSKPAYQQPAEYIMSTKNFSGKHQEHQGVNILSMQLIDIGPGWSRLRYIAERNAKNNETDVIVHSELFAPGWEAMIDGGKIKIQKVDYFLQGVEVPPGRHEIKWFYFPKEFLTGFFISCIGFMVVIIFLIITRINLVGYSTNYMFNYPVHLFWIIGLISIVFSFFSKIDLWIESFISWNLL